MPYDPMLVQPMRNELTSIGVEELRSAAEVDTAFSRPGTTLVVVNSVCGCAAGAARPAVGMAKNHVNQPDHYVTVFAGQDLEATSRAREYFTNQPPSSPSMALLKDGKLVGMIPRHFIEGRMPQQIAQALAFLFDEHCAVEAAQ